jgi:YHS domain-containing protein
MRKIIIVGMVIAAAALFSAAAMEKGKCMKEGGMTAGCMKDGKMMHGLCCMPGAEMKVENTKDGVIIKWTAKDAGTIKKLQEAAADMQKCAVKKGSEAAKPGDEIVQCPVMGEKFPKSKAFAVKEYKGKKYYFCCARCTGEFDKNPEKYAK